MQRNHLMTAWVKRSASALGRGGHSSCRDHRRSVRGLITPVAKTTTCAVGVQRGGLAALNCVRRARAGVAARCKVVPIDEAGWTCSTPRSSVGVLGADATRGIRGDRARRQRHRPGSPVFAHACDPWASRSCPLVQVLAQWTPGASEPPRLKTTVGSRRWRGNWAIRRRCRRPRPGRAPSGGRAGSGRRARRCLTPCRALSPTRG